VLGLEAARKMKIMNLIVYGDAELIVKQIRKVYQPKNPRMRSYNFFAWDLIDFFYLTFNIHVIPIHEN
jgi:ribonuclease HI